MLHKAERRTAITKTVRETEAEAIAFVVSQAIGLDTGHASADYIHLYHGNAALLTESLEVIQRTSALILSAIEKPAITQGWDWLRRNAGSLPAAHIIQEMAAFKNGDFEF